MPEVWERFGGSGDEAVNLDTGTAPSLLPPFDDDCFEPSRPIPRERLPRTLGAISRSLGTR